MNDYTLMHGDCLDLLPTLDAQSVDAVICDIPSGRTACAWDSVIPFEPMWEALRRVTKPRGAIVLLGCTQPFTSALVMSWPKGFKYEWIWEKNNATGYLDANKKPLRAHENIVVFADRLPAYFPQKTTGHAPTHSGKRTSAGGVYDREIDMRAYADAGDRYPRSVQRFKQTHESEGIVHPTQKPLALLEYLIRTYTNAGDTVLDFTMGSGTTGTAAANTGRRFVGIERDDAYFAIAQERIATAYAPLRAMEASR